jgi:hypothetical protein
MKITNLKFYNGSRQKVCRLGLADLFLEVQEVLIDTRIGVKDKADGNGAGALREPIDAQFGKREDWVLSKSGSVNWVKRVQSGETFLTRLGVQVPARSDMLIRDLVHLRNSLQSGKIDVGIIEVPSDSLQRLLTDRTPSYADAIRYIESEFPEGMNWPIVLIAVEHNECGTVALPKKTTNRGKATK